jgi:hypothetical protein
LMAGKSLLTKKVLKKSGTCNNAPMVELVDTLVLEASVARHPSSSLGWGTISNCTGKERKYHHRLRGDDYKLYCAMEEKEDGKARAGYPTCQCSFLWYHIKTHLTVYPRQTVMDISVVLTDREQMLCQQ